MGRLDVIGRVIIGALVGALLALVLNFVITVVIGILSPPSPTRSSACSAQPLATTTSVGASNGGTVVYLGGFQTCEISHSHAWTTLGAVVAGLVIGGATGGWILPRRRSTEGKRWRPRATAHG